ncbi:hypothetical protein G7Z17_g11285 [Cylindrodendrum hubeiense]|uniref:Uncharacterized protein n=1 Tax=Cylindrodendrum hubeiense TaxID=595255 RepID=A0A9P5LBT3_9HYPO|nr:hypothetical protein G7Z17_g11285 [Cylindrodendrum hubeiense]
MLIYKVFVGLLVTASTALGVPTPGKADKEVSSPNVTDKDSSPATSDIVAMMGQVESEDTGNDKMQKAQLKTETKSKENKETAGDKPSGRREETEEPNGKPSDKSSDNPSNNPNDQTSIQTSDQTDNKPVYITADMLKEIAKENIKRRDRNTGEPNYKPSSNPNDPASTQMSDQTDNKPSSNPNDQASIQMSDQTDKPVYVTADKLEEIAKHMSKDKTDSKPDYVTDEYLRAKVKQASEDKAGGKAKCRAKYDAAAAEKSDKLVQHMSTDMMMDLVRQDREAASRGRAAGGRGGNMAQDGIAKANADAMQDAEATRNLTELLFNRPLTYTEYYARNWMWLRCRTVVSNQFDVGGGWVRDYGREMLAEARRVRCGLINWQFEYANGQRWGDAYMSFDWWTGECDQIQAVRAAIRAARRAAMEARRELYIYNCRGFDDYPWSFVEMRRGRPETVDHNAGLGLDPAATAQEKWFNGQLVPGYAPIAPNTGPKPEPTEDIFGGC